MYIDKAIKISSKKTNIYIWKESKSYLYCVWKFQNKLIVLVCLITQEVNKKIKKSTRTIVLLFDIFVGSKLQLSHECFQKTLLVLRKTHLSIDTGEINEFFILLFNKGQRLNKSYTSIVYLIRVRQNND